MVGNQCARYFNVGYSSRYKQGVVITGRNTTGPPRAASLWVTLRHREMLQTTTDDDRRQRTLLVWSSYIMCRRSSDKILT